MNAIAPVQPRPAREVRVVEDNSAVAYLFDTARFEHMQRIATAMASASLIPDHLKGKVPGADGREQTIGNCFLIVNQAVRWQMDPFAVAPETYAIGGKLSFQGKLVAAVINARGGLKERLRYTFEGAGDNRKVTVHGTFAGEDEERIIDLTVGEAKTTNGMWTKDPDQKLIYSGVTKWARRHCPEIVLGVLTDDDLERITEGRGPESARDITPRPTREQFSATNQVSTEKVDETAEATAELGPHDTTAAGETKPILTIVAVDGQVLEYEDQADFIKDLYLELETAKKGGKDALTGWHESQKLDQILPNYRPAFDKAYAAALASVDPKKATVAGAGMV